MKTMKTLIVPLSNHSFADFRMLWVRFVPFYVGLSIGWLDDYLCVVNTFLFWPVGESKDEKHSGRCRVDLGQK